MEIKSNSVCKCKELSTVKWKQLKELFETQTSKGGSRSKKHNKKLSRSSNRKNTKLTGGRNRNRNINRNRKLSRLTNNKKKT